MTQPDETKSLEKFVLGIIEEGPSDQDVYGYIARLARIIHFGAYF